MIGYAWLPVSTSLNINIDLLNKIGQLTVNVIIFVNMEVNRKLTLILLTVTYVTKLYKETIVGVKKRSEDSKKSVNKIS